MFQINFLKDDLIKQRRKFICKYDVQEISLTESKVKNIGLFIFNDILLLAKKRKPSIMPFSSSPLKKSKHKYSPSSSSPFTPFGADYSGGVGEYRFLYLVEWTKVNVVTVDENRGYNELLIQLEIFLDVEKNHVIQLGNQSLKSEPVATLKAIDEEYGKRHIHFLRSKEYKEILSVIRKTQFDLCM